MTHVGEPGHCPYSQTREEHSLFFIPSWSLHYQVSWHFFIQTVLCSLVTIVGTLFIKCSEFLLRTVLFHGEHLLIFKDIYGLLNRSMGGVLIGRNHRFYLTYTVYNHCERLASVGKESISSWALLTCAWNLCKLLILMIRSLCLYNNFPPNTHFPVNTQKSGMVQSDS